MARILAKLYGKDIGKCSEIKEMVKDLYIRLFESSSIQYSKSNGVGSASTSKSASASQPFGSGNGLTCWELDDNDDVTIDNPFS